MKFTKLALFMTIFSLALTPINSQCYFHNKVFKWEKRIESIYQWGSDLIINTDRLVGALTLGGLGLAGVISAFRKSTDETENNKAWYKQKKAWHFFAGATSLAIAGYLALEKDFCGNSKVIYLSHYR